MTDLSTEPEIAPVSSMPGPASMTLKQIRQMRSHAPSLFSELRQEYGPVLRFPYGTTHGYLLADPAIVQDVYVVSDRKFEKDVVVTGKRPEDRQAPLASILGKGLATSAGDFHRKQRRTIQPVFNRQRIFGYGTVFARHAEIATADWRDGRTMNIHDEMFELALGMVARTVFDVALDGAVSRTIRTAFPRKGGPLMWEQVLGIGRFMVKLPLPRNVKFRRGRKKLNKIVYRMIDDRRAGDLQGDDLLSVLLATKDAETGEGMDNEVVRDEAITLLMAGHETSAAALTWSYHLLSQNPEARRRMHAEIDEVLGDRLPTLEDLPRLKYVDAVFSEALRLYPPVWATVRRSLVEYTGAGYAIPANSFVMVSPWVVHHDPTWWPEPETFAPQRWLAPEPAADRDGADRDGSATDPLAGQAVAPGRPRMAYLPFGAGPRQCIGNSFARMEAVMALATIGRNWEFEPVEQKPIRLLTHITVQPRSGLRLLTKRRHRPPSAPPAAGE